MTYNYISRRNFLKGSLAGMTLVLSAGPLGFRIVNASDKDVTAFSPTSWFTVTPDNKVTIFVGNSEMGQGVLTAHAMIVADELEADWKQVEVRQGPAGDAFKSPLLGVQLTAGSASVRGFYEPLRKTGATGRAMLVKAAAQTWKVPETECQASMGTVKHIKSGRALTYGKLCQEAAKLQVPQEVTLKKESEFRYIGKTMPRVDVPLKVSGKAVYGVDVKLKDLHYAVIARPPAYGAKPLSFDEKAAGEVKGVKKVFQVPMGIAVCAETLDSALKGRDALAVKWDKGVLPEMDDAYVEKSLVDDLGKPMASAVKTGDAKKEIGEAAMKHEATYYVPCVAHATMEPMNCTASVTADRCEVWAPTQIQSAPVAIGAKLTGLPKEKIFVNTTFLGGGFGRRSKPDFVVEAILCSKALGKPVKVMWTREEDIKYDAFRPPTSHRVAAALDAQGRLIAWSHKLVCPSILKDIRPEAIKDGVDFYCLWGLADAPQSPHWINRIQYEIPNLDIEFLISQLPMPVAVWRSVQNGPNAFVIESFMDELAHAAGKDPLEFRLQALKNNMRAHRVLETVAEKAGWGKSIPQGQARGIAQHACFGTYTAQVADISVDKKNGKIKVHRNVIAVDCGPRVNPGPLVQQIQGGIILALSTTLKEQVHFANGGVKSANFDDYGVIRMSEVPDIEVHIVNSTEKMGGIGELGVPTTAPAVANAFFNATGVRIRRLPLSPGNVLAALTKV
ncbi:MAG TPA: xanthine dehydrogenase family protein molybdopterin-binding subunit [Syntrophobacteraceae bacterium]|nr:xanthine dehydrogenase family protein molybdopterin-binding subunit [Syntrophobacteraceae bacterium]